MNNRSNNESLEKFSRISVREFFDRTDSRETLPFGFRQQLPLLRTVIANHLRNTDAHRILDVASGTGELSKLMMEILPSSNCTLLDISLNTLREAWSGLRVQGHGQNLPFLPHVFDVVLCRQGLHYMDLSKALSEFSRVLSQQGTLIIANEWWFNGDESPEEIRWSERVARSRGKPDHALLKRSDILDAIQSTNLQIIHHIESYDTYFVPENDWIHLYDSIDESLSDKRRHLLTAAPAFASLRGYPHLTDETVSYISRWMIAVATQLPTSIPG